MLALVEVDPERSVDQRLERALVRERERLRTLLEVGRMLDSTLPRDKLLTHVLAAAARVTQSERATLYLVDSTHNTLLSHATEGGVPGTIVLKMGEGIAGAAATARRSVLVPDAYADTRFVPTWDQRTGFRTRSVLAAPMLTPAGQVVGVLQVLNRADQGAFDADDVEMLEALAAQAALSIDGAARMQAIVQQNRALMDLRRRLERSLRERNTLLEMEQLLARTDSLDEFVSGALAGLARACGAARGAVALADEGTGRVEVRAAYGVSDPAQWVGRSLEDECLASHAMMDSTVLRAPDGTNGVPAGASCLGLPARAVLVVPVPGTMGALGVIELCDREGDRFSEDDGELATLVAVNMSTGVELVRGRLERERTLRLAAVGQTLSNVLHDIRTPMAIISGYAQLMPTESSQDERQRLADGIVRQFGHVQAMVREVLAFVRGESNLLPQKVIVELFFAELADVVTRALAPRGVRVQLDMEARGSFRFDTAKITRLAHNLARNAAEAMTGRTDGVFSMRVARDGDELVLTFEDNGPGISERVRARLFHRFVSEGKPQGTGLGLAIVKKLVDEHGGTLDVDTGAWGTRFVVRLPSSTPGPSAGPISSFPPALPDDQRDPSVPASVDGAVGTGTN